MALRMRRIKPPETDNNIFWTTMADLMLGLAICFMTLFVLAMTGYTQESVRQKVKQIEMSKEIAEKLQQENINAQIDEMTGDIKISDLELFEVGSAKLSQRGKVYLNKFAPIYINTIFSKKDVLEGVENIVIQGHTDSQMYAGVNNPNIQYIKNMELSLERANSVAEYMLSTNYDKKYNEKLKKILIVEGRSFSDPIIVNGKEDYNKSRRVEMHLKAKDFDIKNVLVGGKHI